MVVDSQLHNTMQDSINKLVVKEKGILAIDESIATIGKRFDPIGLENTAENRAKYRSLIASTKDLSKYISGAILFEETLAQNLVLPVGTKSDNSDITIAEQLARNDILIGIKVDQGLEFIYPGSNERFTKGIDDLTTRLINYKNSGAAFAKWRAVFSIDPTSKLPSKIAIRCNIELLARYAAICQALAIIPIVEPEVLMDGNHSINDCSEVTTQILVKLFKVLRKYNVALEYMLLKPNMILPGKANNITANSTTIAAETLKVLKRTVPAAVPSINFLSGGQSESEATENLCAINKLGSAPWHLSFSFGRALQTSCIKTWQGKDNNWKSAQQVLLAQAKQNSLANLGVNYV